MSGPDRHPRQPDADQPAGLPPAAEPVPPLPHRRARVATPVPGAAVYPGFLQVGGFMSLNLRRHLSSHARDLPQHRARRGRGQPAHPRLLRRVLRRPRHGRRVLPRDRRADLPAGPAGPRRDDPPRPAGAARSRSRKTALLTIEAERDDMCAPGQTAAAHELFTGIAPAHAPPPPAARRRPLRRVRRQPWSSRGLSRPQSFIATSAASTSTRGTSTDVSRRPPATTCPATRTRPSASSRPARRWASPPPPCCSRASPSTLAQPRSVVREARRLGRDTARIVAGSSKQAPAKGDSRFSRSGLGRTTRSSAGCARSTSAPASR